MFTLSCAPFKRGVMRVYLESALIYNPRIHLSPRHHHITPVLKSLHWLKFPERIHFKVLSLTFNSFQSSQVIYLREFFTIQPTRFTRSSSCLTLPRPRSPLLLRSPKES